MDLAVTCLLKWLSKWFCGGDKSVETRMRRSFLVLSSTSSKSLWSSCGNCLNHLIIIFLSYERNLALGNKKPYGPQELLKIWSLRRARSKSSTLAMTLCPLSVVENTTADSVHICNSSSSHLDRLWPDSLLQFDTLSDLHSSLAWRMIVGPQGHSWAQKDMVYLWKTNRNNMGFFASQQAANRRLQLICVVWGIAEWSLVRSRKGN